MKEKVVVWKPEIKFHNADILIIVVFRCWYLLVIPRRTCFIEVNIKKQKDAIFRKKQEKSWAPFSPLILEMLKLRRGIRLQFFSVIGATPQISLIFQISTSRCEDIGSFPVQLVSIHRSSSPTLPVNEMFCYCGIATSVIRSVRQHSIRPLKWDYSPILQCYNPSYPYSLLISFSLGPWSHAC